MKTIKIWANLAVSDLTRTTRFYTALGFQQNGQPNNELTSFIFGDENFIIHFFTKERFSSGINGKMEDVPNGNEVIFSISAQSEAEVHQWAENAVKAGGTIYAETQKFDKGLTVGFADPDGHKFNALYWPEA